MQSKKMAHLEALTNQVTGILLGWMIVYFIFPWIGIPVTVTQATLSSVIFFVVSYTRSYLIRRFFNTLERKWKLQKKI